MNDFDFYIKELLLKSPRLKDINIMNIFNQGVDPKFLRALTQYFWVHEETDPNEDFSFVFLLQHEEEKDIYYKMYCSCICPVVTVRFYVFNGGIMQELIDTDLFNRIQKSRIFSLIEKTVNKFDYKIIHGDFLRKAIGKEIAAYRGLPPSTSFYNAIFSEY
jgi:hypothetical protein